jgi:cytochrome bd-type quinol oxidase subunit 2
MKNKFKLFLLTLFSTGFFLPLLGHQALAINLFENTCSKAAAKDSSVCHASNNSQNDSKYNNVVLRTINSAANVIALVAGVAAVIMVIVAGISYIMAGSNAEQTKTARNRILYAAIGMVVIASAWTITRFVTDNVLKS